MSRNYLTGFWHPLFEVFPGFVWSKLHSDVILILISDTFTSKSVLYINCFKKRQGILCTFYWVYITVTVQPRFHLLERGPRQKNPLNDRYHNIWSGQQHNS